MTTAWLVAMVPRLRLVDRFRLTNNGSDRDAVIGYHRHVPCDVTVAMGAISVEVGVSFEGSVAGKAWKMDAEREIISF